MPYVVHGLVAARTARDAVEKPAADEGDPAVEVVEHRDVAALVTATEQEEILPSRANLLGHTKVLEQAAAIATVLPMRFGVVVPDADTLVATFLEPEHDALAEHLASLDGHVEMRLRGTYTEDQVVREVLASDPKAARLRGRNDVDARLELGERVAAGIETRRAHDAARAVDALRRHAADVAAGRTADPLDAFTLSFLVDHDRMDAFDDAADRLGRDLAPLIRLELVGPLPPFSFAAAGAA